MSYQKIYVGDVMLYTTELFLNNGWTEKMDSTSDITNVVSNLASLVFIKNHHERLAEWSDDCKYLTFN